jgi:hypothetical protein
MPPSMHPVERSQTKLARKTKAFEVVHVGPIRLYFSHWTLIGFESDKTKIVVCVPPKSAASLSRIRTAVTMFVFVPHAMCVFTQTQRWRVTPYF